MIFRLLQWIHKLTEDYFITSSQADRILYPTTESFGLDTTVKQINNFSIYNYNKTFIFLLFSRKGQTLCLTFGARNHQHQKFKQFPSSVKKDLTYSVLTKIVKLWKRNQTWTVLPKLQELIKDDLILDLKKLHWARLSLHKLSNHSFY